MTGSERDIMHGMCDDVIPPTNSMEEMQYIHSTIAHLGKDGSPDPDNSGLCRYG
jgi:hypothetical protein